MNSDIQSAYLKGHNSGQSDLRMAYLIAAGLSPNNLSGSQKNDSLEKDGDVSSIKIGGIGGVYNMYQPGIMLNSENPSQAQWGEQSYMIDESISNFDDQQMQRDNFNKMKIARGLGLLDESLTQRSDYQPNEVKQAYYRQQTEKVKKVGSDLNLA